MFLASIFGERKTGGVKENCEFNKVTLGNAESDRAT